MDESVVVVVVCCLPNRYMSCLAVGAHSRPDRRGHIPLSHEYVGINEGEDHVWIGTLG
jgi:hypothetical protein